MNVQAKLEELVNKLEFVSVNCQEIEFDQPKVGIFVDDAIGAVEMAISHLEEAIEESIEETE